MELNFLNLKQKKNYFFYLDSLTFYNSGISLLASYYHLFASSLGVIFDSAVKFDKQISSIVKTGFFHLMVRGKMKAYLKTNEFENLSDSCHCCYLLRLL